MCYNYNTHVKKSISQTVQQVHVGNVKCFDVSIMAYKF